MKQLKHLDLSGTRVTDTSLKPLAALTSLEYLKLTSAPITDAGLKHLVGLTKLKHLNLIDTRVTSAGAEFIMKALPHCEVRRTVVRGSLLAP